MQGELQKMKEKNLKINSVLNVIKTLSSIIFPLITFPYASRVLLPDNMGKVTFGSAYVSYFVLLATLGISTYAIRECSAARNNQKKLEKVASEIYSINICTTIVSYILLGISLLLFQKLNSYIELVLLQSIVIVFTTLGADWLNTAMEDFAYITIRTIAFQILSLVLMFVLVKTPDDYIKYALISVISSSGANFLNIFYRKKYCKIHFTFDMRWKEHFMPILYLFVMILAQTIFSSADITMLGIMKDDFVVGIYSTAVKVQYIIVQVVASLTWVVMPRMSEYFAEGNYDKINAMLKNVAGVLVAIGAPCIAGVLSISKEIVYIVGGAEYADAAVPLCILMISFAFSLIGGSFLGNMVLLPSKQEKIYMIICCISTVVNVILNFILIPIGGAVAASITTALSSLIIMVLLLLTKDKRVKLNYLGKVMFSPIVGSILIMVYCYGIGMVVNQWLIKTVICIIGSGLIYGATLLLLKNEIFIMLLDGVKGKLYGGKKNE